MKKKRVPVDTELEVAAAEPTEEVVETAAETVVEETPVVDAPAEEVAVCEKKKCKFSVYTLFAIVLTVLPIAIACILNCKILIASNKFVEETILSAVLALFKIGTPEFTVFSTGTLGTLYSLTLKLVPVVMVASVVMMVVSIVAPKTAKTLSRVIALANFIVYLAITLMTMCVLYYVRGHVGMNYSAFIIGLVSGLAYIALAFMALKAKAILPVINCGLSALISLCYLFSMVFVNKADTIIIMKASTLHAAMYLTMLSLVGAVFIFSLIRMMLVKAKILDLICFVLNAIMAVGVIVVGYFVVDNMKSLVLYVLIAFVFSAIQVLLSTISFKKEKKEKAEIAASLVVTEEEVAAETTEEAPAEETAEVCECVCEETATQEVVEEVVAEPVEEVPAAVAVSEETEDVLEAEPVTANVPVDNLPVVDPICEKAQASVEEYTVPRFMSSYMNEKKAAAPTTIAFDWFLESLTSEEKQEFTELFVYKYLGGTATLPEYVPGGNNYAFFRAFFLNLGKYRNRISDTLLEKMYQYMVKKY